ncbi:kinase-like domain-containing protein [Achaetomium macrosporum]|uniref:Kinase-like domain-containing protein n=1 Tax=Achaetomium macrosporum TaxID=79813 RepID=A0AAN7HHF7_9PEZI|nr:kinase-like domain-containing protein [Achaetomium macrosporum]
MDQVTGSASNHRGCQSKPFLKPAIFQANAQVQQLPSTYDDDITSELEECLRPMKLSALTKAILGDNYPSDASLPGESVLDGRAPRTPIKTCIPAPVRRTSGDQESLWRRSQERGNRSSSTPPSWSRSRVASRKSSIPTARRPASATSSNKSSPTSNRADSARPRRRVVRLHSNSSANTANNSSSTPGYLRRTISSSTKVKRPASSDGPKVAKVKSRVGQHEQPVETPPVPVRTVRIAVGSSGHKRTSAVSSNAPSNYNTRSASREVLPGSASITRPSVPAVKRAVKTPGGYLSGPARRGLRRQSEEVPKLQESKVSEQQPSQIRNSQDPLSIALNTVNSAPSAMASNPRPSQIRARHAPPSLASNPVGPVTSGSPGIALVPLQKSKDEDKENEAPSMARIMIRGKDDALVSSNLNNQRQAPPPPPKMSVVDTVTTSAGASTAGQVNRKKQFLFRVNGRSYTRIDTLGRGGSGKVYRVSAESGKLLALKRVSLGSLSEKTKGYQWQEVDLLKRLAGVDRVVQMIDYEYSPSKETLTLVLEAGELDFQAFLRGRNAEDSEFDPTFVRYWWKEMVECVRAVHAKDIVHSDLKPANFVLCQGRLKVIDFGIANRIEIEETVHVHRESQVGTPNYLSPESLLDVNEYALSSAAQRLITAPQSQKVKHYKIGKASDVWSLGCILYQMVYGAPPFANSPHMIARVQAICDWDHVIPLPDVTMASAPVPPSLIRTMRRCLNRDASLRPTCDELLSKTDPFLYPLELQEVYRVATLTC